MADPGELIKQQVQKHFPKFGSLRKDCTYQHLGNQDYIPGNVPADNIIAEYPLKIIVYPVTGSLLSAVSVMVDDQADILKTRAAVFPALDLPIAPVEKDTILFPGEGGRWEIIGLSPDPAPGSYEIVIKPM